ncbi:unnamed protein product, partial [Discosporangium mesarthrocarpum]
KKRLLPSARASFRHTMSPRKRKRLFDSAGRDLPWLPNQYYINRVAATDEFCLDGRPYFSLQTLIRLVNDEGEGWPGIQAAIFGTFSLGIRTIMGDLPEIFSAENTTIPVLILHGDPTLERQEPRWETGKKASRTAGIVPSSAAVEGGRDAPCVEKTNAPRGVVAAEVSGTGTRTVKGQGHNCTSRFGEGEGGEAVGIGRAYKLHKKPLQQGPHLEHQIRLEKAGRGDRAGGWLELMSPMVQVEKLLTGSRGVHHPKFGLIFLHDGSLVVYVTTANLGTGGTVDGTWCQLFPPRWDGDVEGVVKGGFTWHQE